MSYQPEERYWTDYLRIALPIAGLLLLLGVFWYWASSFIGDDTNDPGLGTQVAVVETPITAPTQTATVGAAVNIEAVNTVAPTQEPTQQAAAPTATTGSSTESGTGTDDGFAEGDKVVVNDNDVNLRADASTSSDIVEVLTNGSELTILSSTPQEDEDYIWWNVRTTEGNEGWVVSQYLQASGT
ncbi:MAG: SH3 domain-containing protein [Thermomicrobiales bacterium]|nr:SH3 domain-containing protein [Thermomicrobiales bacterium]